MNHLVHCLHILAVALVLFMSDDNASLHAQHVFAQVNSFIHAQLGTIGTLL